MREAVVILLPDVRGEQVVERRDGLSPGDALRGLEPLGVLVEHRVDDVDERLVAVEQTVPARQQVALEPALAEMLREHLEHAPIAAQSLVRVLALALPGARRRLEHRRQPVRRRLVGADDAEVVGIPRDHVAQEGAEHPRRLAALVTRPGDADGVVAEIRQQQVAQQHAAVGVGVGTHAPLAARRERGDVPGRAHPSRRTAPRVDSSAASPRAAGGARRSGAPPRSAPDASARCPRRAARRPSRGMSSPSACAGRSSARPAARPARRRGPCAGCARSRRRPRPASPPATGGRAPDPRRRSPRKPSAGASRSLSGVSAARTRECVQAPSGSRSCSR